MSNKPNESLKAYWRSVQRRKTRLNVLGSSPQADAEFPPLSRSNKDPARSLADYQRYYGEEHWRNEIDGRHRLRVREW